MADGSWLMAMVQGPSPIARSHQPLAMTEIRDLMWRNAGLFRTRGELTAAVQILEHARPAAPPATPAEWRHRNLVTVAQLIARAALRREESRGGHFREDFPERDDRRWNVHVVDLRGAA